MKVLKFIGCVLGMVVCFPIGMSLWSIGIDSGNGMYSLVALPLLGIGTALLVWLVNLVNDYED